MTGTINNGRREEVSFGDYDGLAGVVERDGVVEVAFPGRARLFERGMVGLIDGDAYSVADVQASRFVSTMVVLTVVAVTPAPTA